jgi:predicted DNA repair protein MutK
MSGLLALLDDVAAIAKLAAAQLDDVAAQAGKAGVKAAGVVIDDAAVTPKYVTGLPAARELPIVWKIARASFFNKLVILLPGALLLQAFVPWILTPLLMVGGAYLCFEGAEKVWHTFVPHKDHGPQQAKTLDAAHLEEQRVKGAIKTDFILSAEIMTISLSQISTDTLWIQAAALAAVAIGITALVYGAVAVLVKADDFGMLLSAKGRLAVTKSVGRRIVKSMPSVMASIAAIGTVAMLWVGGSIIVHGLQARGWHLPYDLNKDAAAFVASFINTAEGFVTWFVTAGLDGIVGLALGFALIPIVTRALAPTMAWLFPENA